MDLTSPLTRTAAGLARRTLVPPLIVLDRHVVVPVLGDRSTAHRLLAAVTGATAAVTSHPTAAPNARGPQGPSASEHPAEDDATGDDATGDETTEAATTEDAATEDETTEDETTEDETTEDETTEDDTTASESESAATDGSAGDADAPESLTSNEQERIEELTEQLLEEESTGSFVGELADDELRRAQAQVRAKQLVEEQDAGSTGSDGS